MINKILLLLFLTLLSQAGYSQKVGLVLSGGGAKGLAHIAIIRALEENNIPIDFIAGTSMGAIIGGLYASGYTPDEMEELFRSDDFYFWSTGKIQEEYRYYYKQREENPSWIELRMEKREDKLKLLPPTNIVPQWQMDFAFMELTAASTAVANGDFDQLMVPFRCVATEVHHNLPVVLSKGDLGEAIRASMTIPFVFKPIQIDGKLLFDGGIVNNFPQDVMMEAFHPDIIIGHNVVEGSKTAESDDLLTQVINMIQRPTEYKIAPEKGIFLETKTTSIGVLDFEKIDQITELGKQTIIPMIDSIKVRVNRRVSQEELARRRESFNARKPALLYQNIQIEGIGDAMQVKYIINSIKHNKNIFTVEAFKKEYFKLIADEQIKSIRPTAHFNNASGYFDVYLNVEAEKKSEINIGGNISTKPINQGFANFEHRLFQNRSYTLASNIYFGRFYSSFKVGGRIDLPTTKPYYLSSYLTLNRWDFYASSNELFFEDVRPPYIIQYENSWRNEIGFPVGLHEKLNFGLAWSGSQDHYYQIEKYNKEDTPDKTNFNASVTHVEYENNSLNIKQFATEGVYNNISARFIAGKESNIPGTTAENQQSQSKYHSYFLVKALTTHFYPVNKKISLGTHFEGVFSNKKDFFNYASNMLAAPGFNPTPHSRTIFIEKFHANNFIAAGFKSIYFLTPDVHTRIEGYAFIPLFESQKAVDFSVTHSDVLIKKIHWQGLAAIVLNTGVGPLSLALNYYDKPNTKWYWSLNFGYVLFNKRGL
jgi:NTE family protein